jgi:hypothetical protein
LGAVSENKLFKNPIFQKHFFIKVGLLVQYSPKQIFFGENLTNFFTQKNDFVSQNFEFFEEVVHNFGKADNDMI